LIPKTFIRVSDYSLPEKKNGGRERDGERERKCESTYRRLRRIISPSNLLNYAKVIQRVAKRSPGTVGHESSEKNHSV
jgi:hypothetical protein